jgi:hypothetical protein
MIPGLLLSGLASAIMLAGADHVALLFVGGSCSARRPGIALVVASAWMQEIDRSDPLWTARLLGIVIYGGFGAGPLVGGVVGQWGPARLVTPYLVHLALVAAAFVVMRLVPETVTRPAGRRVSRTSASRLSRGRCSGASSRPLHSVCSGCHRSRSASSPCCCGPRWRRWPCS